jgi:hypothetical protein
MIEFLKDNYQWLFSGVGSGLIFYFLGRQHGYSKATKQSMKVGDQSTGIQVGGNVTSSTIKGGGK